jgi:disulfide bond formation protein DsbB
MPLNAGHQRIQSPKKFGKSKEGRSIHRATAYAMGGTWLKGGMGRAQEYPDSPRTCSTFVQFVLMRIGGDWGMQLKKVYGGAARSMWSIVGVYFITVHFVRLA